MSAATEPRIEPRESCELSDAVGSAAAEPAWRRRMAGHLAWNLASDVAARGASLWLSLACARLLPVEGYGRFTFALALTQWVWLAGDAMANAGYATRELARMRAEGALESAAALGGAFWRARLTAAAVLVVVLAIALALIPGPAATEPVLLAASISFVTIAAFPDWALRAAEDFRGLALANTAAAVALVASTTVVLPRWPHAWAAAAAWAGSFAVSALIALVRVHHNRILTLAGPAIPWRAHLRRSGVFALGAAAGIGSAQAPMILAGLLCTSREAGLFGAGYRLIIAVVGVFAILWWPLFPMLARERAGSVALHDALVTFSGIVLLLGMPVGLACAIFPREILTLLFGTAYAEGATALRLGGLAMPLYAVSGLLEQVALARGHEALRARTHVTALVLMVLTSAFAIPHFGASGAAGSLLVGFAWTIASFLSALHRDLPLADMARRAGAAIGLSAGLGLFWWSSRAVGLPAIPMLIAGCAGFVGTAMCTGLLPTPHCTQQAAA